MFDSLSEKLQETLADVRQRGTLTDDDVNRVMREIRLSLLEADVNFKVVKQFTNAVKERALGIEITKQLNPGQQVIKIVNDALIEALGGAPAEQPLYSRLDDPEQAARVWDLSLRLTGMTGLGTPAAERDDGAAS